MKPYIKEFSTDYFHDVIIPLLLHKYSVTIYKNGNPLISTDDGDFIIYCGTNSMQHTQTRQWIKGADDFLIKHYIQDDVIRLKKYLYNNIDDFKNAQDSIDKAKEDGLCVFTDGAMNNALPSNPMKFAYSIFEKDNLLEEKVFDKAGGNNSVNKAEAYAVIYALDFLNRHNCNSEKITFFSDSKIVMNICNKRKPPKEGSIFYKAALSLLRGIELFDDVHFHWIPREFNTYTDGLMR